MAWRRPAALAVAAALITSGCAWGERYRTARPRETLELESFTVEVPEDATWKVSRYRDAQGRSLELAHSRNGVVDATMIIVEQAGGDVPGTGEEMLARLRKVLPALLTGDASPRFAELPAAADPRFGPSAVQALARVEESDASAGLLVKRVVSGAVIEFVPPSAPGRLAVISYLEEPRRGATAAELDERWRSLLAGVAFRPVDREAVLAAARGSFPRSMEAGLARRSLTLPPVAVQWSWMRERWIAPGGFDGTSRLRVGLTERLELSAPGFLRLAFGDPAALVGPEVAIGAGWSSFGHDAEHGSVWGGAISASARKRFGADWAATGEVLVEGRHESRTDRNRLQAAGAAGVVWDVHALVSLGLEAGYKWQEGVDSTDRVAWLGGQRTPLVTLHLPPLDVGLVGGVGWDGDRLGLLAGCALALTF